MVAELVMGPQPPATKAAFFALRSSRERAAFTGWKVDGWVRWLEGLRGAYERRMNRVCRILDEGSTAFQTRRPAYGPAAGWGVVSKMDLFDFAWPRGGMFVWLRVNFEQHPLWRARRTDPAAGLIDGPVMSTALMLYLASAPHLVLLAPGTMFSATDRVREEVAWAYFRLCFAAEAEEKVDACSERFVDGVKKFWRIRKVADLEHILDNPILASSEEPIAEMGNLGVWQGC
jgi:DNA-binding transcriptional MocR family regulator